VSRAWGLLLALGACGEAARGEAGPALDLSPDACAGCHAEAADSWRTSMHARAWDDPVFRREYEGRPHEACRDCHAPVTSAPGRATGIDCAACHVRGGEVLAGEVSAAGLRAHPMRAAPELRAPEFCGQCHQFAFIADGVHAPDEALQNTLIEYYASSADARGLSCVSCHMPAGSHAFPGIHDPRQLARALKVDVAARRVAGGIDVAVTLEGADIGHSFPTGDVFRRAVLRVSTPNGVSAELEMQRWLARTADEEGEASHVRTVDDTRVPPPGQGVLRETLHLQDAEATEVVWEVVLHRLPPARAAAAGLGPEVVTRFVAGGQARWVVHAEPR